MQFDEIYIKYFKDVYLYLLKLSGNESVAEDITSETFFKAMKNIDSYRGECSLYAWLCQIAKNTYYTYLNKNKRIVDLDESQIDEVVPGVDISEENKEELLMIKKYLHQIPEPYKEVFMWRVFADMKYDEIGRIFGKTANWACVTYHRAKKMITDKLEEEK
ncbi:MAG: sigma-70 family RNA polymerase sigma factor [Saccharofermentans sp.]|nr:sigma-70 family RNA polymerase sigma factor [Saccharofermentans sp.]